MPPPSDRRVSTFLHDVKKLGYNVLETSVSQPRTSSIEIWSGENSGPQVEELDALILKMFGSKALHRISSGTKEIQIIFPALASTREQFVRANP